MLYFCRCQIRLGRGQEEGHPNWSSGFRMIREGGVMRLFVRRGEGRPNRLVYCCHLFVM